MWNHNTHFHNYLLSQFPGEVNRSLDIGCGLGLFARKLANRSKAVDALDVDSATIKAALAHNTAPNICYIHADFLEADLPKESYDIIVSIASLHHMDLKAALEKMKTLLRPSGKFLILGLYRETTIADYLYSLISVPLNLVYLNWHRESMEISRTAAPTLPAQLSIKQIKTVANTLIPGFSLRRHIFWRYSLIWQKQ